METMKKEEEEEEEDVICTLYETVIGWSHQGV